MFIGLTIIFIFAKALSFGFLLIAVLVDCGWSSWNTEIINGFTRVCQKLNCKKGGLGPEIGAGEKTRRRLTEPGPGGKSCSPNGGRSKENCTGSCPGR